MLVSHARPTKLQSDPAEGGGWSSVTTDSMPCPLEERPVLLPGGTVCGALWALYPREVDGGFADHAEHDAELQFGSFRLQPRSRVLLQHGRPVDIGSRAFDLLHVLLRAHGSVVTKAEIVSHVWPDVFVDEINLRVQVFYLRKALGEDRDLVKNVPGRGYLLTVDVSCGPTLVVSSIEELQDCPQRQRSSIGPAGLLADPYREIRCRDSRPIAPCARAPKHAAISPAGANDNDKRTDRRGVLAPE